MRTITPVLLLISQLAVLASAQPRKFEVASIKLCQKGDPPTAGAPSPNRLHLACATTGNLIRLAYLVFPSGQPSAPVSPQVYQIAVRGGPSWVHSDRYTVDAKAEERANVEMIKGPMLQDLLEDRFKLKLHWEARNVDIFELTVAKGGPKLSPSQHRCVVYDRNHPPPEPAPVLCGSLHKAASSGYDVSGVTMAELCLRLSSYVDREIVDKTGVTGVFDVHLDLAPADVGQPDAVADPSSPFTPGDGGAIAYAVQKLGLHMRPGKGSVRFPVIDHVERPSEN